MFSLKKIYFISILTFFLIFLSGTAKANSIVWEDSEGWVTVTGLSSPVSVLAPGQTFRVNGTLQTRSCSNTPGSVTGIWSVIKPAGDAFDYGLLANYSYTGTITNTASYDPDNHSIIYYQNSFSLSRNGSDFIAPTTPGLYRIYIKVVLPNFLGSGINTFSWGYVEFTVIPNQPVLSGSCSISNGVATGNVTWLPVTGSSSYSVAASSTGDTIQKNYNGTERSFSFSAVPGATYSLWGYTLSPYGTSAMGTGSFSCPSLQSYNASCSYIDGSFIGRISWPATANATYGVRADRAPVSFNSNCTITQNEGDVCRDSAFTCDRGDFKGRKSSLGLVLKSNNSENSDQRFLCHVDNTIYRCTKDSEETTGASYWNTFSYRVGNGADGGPNYICNVTQGKWVSKALSPSVTWTGPTSIDFTGISSSSYRWWVDTNGTQTGSGNFSCPAVIVPVCGSAANIATSSSPTANLCSPGTLGDQVKVTTDGTNRWYWDCIGQNTTLSNDTVSCSAPKVSTVSYDGNDNTGGTVPVDSTLYASSTSVIVKSNTGSLVKIGYTFSGWNTQDDGSGTSYDTNAIFTIGTNNVTLYANWTANSYSITFDGNGSTAGSMANQSIVSGSTTPLTSNGFSKTGATFAGWATSTGGLVAYADRANYTMGTANVTLYAKWTTNPSYNVIFNGNGSTAGSMANQSIVSGSTTPLTSNGFSKTGATFAGWATSTGGLVAYANGASYTMGTANVNLYAKWTIIQTPLSASCTGNTTSTSTGQTVTRNITASGGSGVYSFEWTGTDNLAGSGGIKSKIYVATGTKSASVTVTSDAESITATCPSVNIYENGQCINSGYYISKPDNFCIKGTASGNTDWPDGPWSWSCLGSGTGHSDHTGCTASINNTPYNCHVVILGPDTAKNDGKVLVNTDTIFEATSTTPGFDALIKTWSVTEANSTSTDPTPYYQNDWNKIFTTIGLKTISVRVASTTNNLVGGPCGSLANITVLQEGTVIER